MTFLVELRREMLHTYLKINKAADEGLRKLDEYSQLCTENTCVCMRQYKDCPLK